jgi:hypothetical protein
MQGLCITMKSNGKAKMRLDAQGKGGEYAEN